MEAMQQLAGVSRLWRDVILDTPSCWNSIRVAQDVKLAHLWIQLKRSCQALLHVSIRYWWSNDATRRRQFEAQLKLIAPTTCRWKTLSVGENAVWFTRDFSTRTFSLSQRVISTLMQQVILLLY